MKKREEIREKAAYYKGIVDTCTVLAKEQTDLLDLQEEAQKKLNVLNWVLEENSKVE